MKAKLLGALVLLLTTCADVHPGLINQTPLKNLLPNLGLNVIFITWDGVRRQEMSGFPDPALSAGDHAAILPYFYHHWVPKGTFLGLGSSRVITGNTSFMSLPGYQSILTGATTSCFDNNCAPVKTPTLPLFVSRYLRLKSDSVATIASWEKLDHATGQDADRSMVNTGLAPLEDGGSDDEKYELNSLQTTDLPPWGGARWDRYTWGHAMRYLRHHEPRYLHIALNDSDEWAHKNEYGRYLQTLRQYDRWLEELDSTLSNMGQYGKKTCIVMTTDHGRGEGEKWTTHSSGISDSGLVWLYIRCPQINVKFLSNFIPLTTHLSIRPLIEIMMGVMPSFCPVCDKIPANRVAEVLTSIFQ